MFEKLASTDIWVLIIVFCVVFIVGFVIGFKAGNSPDPTLGGFTSIAGSLNKMFGGNPDVSQKINTLNESLLA